MPKEIILIAAVTLDGYIARNRKETIDWSKDLGLFKEQTMGYPIIMGSNTRKTIKSQLPGRDIIVLNRNNSPVKTLLKIQTSRCFIIGGGKTFARFASFITHVYLTPHPYIFGSGVRLFDGENNKEIKLIYIKSIEVESSLGIFQHQYKVNKS